VASRLAVSAVLQSLYPVLLTATDEQWADPGLNRSALRAAFAYASSAIAEASRGDPSLREMATTLAVTVHVGSRMVAGYSGDTRVYAYGTDLKLLSKDHSAAWPLVESGAVELSELRHVGTRSMLTRFVSAESASLEVAVHQAPKDTSFLLATDGFWELFDSSELEALMAPLGGGACYQGAPEDVAEQLLSEALSRKPEDNATFILIAPDSARRRRTGRYPCVERSSVFVRT